MQRKPQRAPHGYVKCFKIASCNQDGTTLQINDRIGNYQRRKNIYYFNRGFHQPFAQKFNSPRCQQHTQPPYQYSNPKDIAITLRINRKLRSDATLG